MGEVGGELVAPGMQDAAEPGQFKVGQVRSAPRNSAPCVRA